jgi:hypothetical protein
MNTHINLLFIHDLSIKYIKSFILEDKNILNDIASNIHSFKDNNLTSQQINILSKFTIKHITSSILSYNELKINFDKLELWLKKKDQIVFFPLYEINLNNNIKEYKEFIKNPINRTFSSNTNTNNESNYINKYINLISEYFDKHIVDDIIQKSTIKEDIKKIVYENNISARAKKYVNNNFNYEENNFSDEDNKNESSSLIFQDLSRVNINQKYKYEKKCHFKDTINQYQGIQNKFIPDNIIKDVFDMLKIHGLYNENDIDPFKKITKEHIRSFLDETGHSKYYEDLQLIYSKITKKPCPNISQYEKKLYEDFDCLVETFLNLNINRKNFLNSHYVLRQLLLRQNVKVPENDLNYLKTPNRLREHDEIFQKCCEILNWNFIPFC